MGELDIDGSAVVDALDQPTVVVDDTDAVVDCNDEYRALVDDDDPTTVAASLAEFPALRSQVAAREPGIATFETDDGNRYFHIRVSEVTDADGTVVGDLVVLHDVTEQQRQNLRLEHQNEQLDQFASLISHDLRNPLDVAIGRTTVIEELVEDDSVDEHFNELETAHSRMRRIIRDVLSLARQGRNIDDTSAISLADAAERAWSHVETAGATLDVRTDATVVADRERLEQAFENLFRNSVEHGSTGSRAGPDDSVEHATDTATQPITVTVDSLDRGDGFYVADDGRGIPPEKHGQVLEAGYTGSDGNTGLGLAIVRNIADAHGWDIEVGSSASGGARFEFRGVEGPPEEQLLQE